MNSVNDSIYKNLTNTKSTRKKSAKGTIRFANNSNLAEFNRENNSTALTRKGKIATKKNNNNTRGRAKPSSKNKMPNTNTSNENALTRSASRKNSPFSGFFSKHMPPGRMTPNTAREKALRRERKQAANKL